MIEDTKNINSVQRSKSPYNFVAPNTKLQFKPLADLLKSPHTQRIILNKANILRSPSTQKKNTSSQKENPQPENVPRFTLSFMHSSAQKEESTTNFNNFTSLRLKSMKNIENPLVKPFQIENNQQNYENGLKEQNFQKIKELGKGKFGNVWLVFHKETKFFCALKIIKKSVVRQQKIEHQIAKQIRIHNQLKNQNIIAFYGFFTDKDNFFILTEYAVQGHVYNRLKNQHRLQEKQVKQITRQTVDGLRIMHNMGYIHRDIKPENILLQFDVVKICDFGWAAECRGNQMRKSQCGTPLYYSPQIVKKEQHNTQIDVWSIGLLAYEMIVGRVPFSIWSEFDLNVILEHQVTVPDYIDCSQNLKDFIVKCLIKNQNQRPLLNDLRQHRFINQGILRVQSIGGLYSQIKALF